ncbi:hypothetical protein [Pedococcus sp. 5OH_020]|uniref:hypothetical protein n=1 Tax=Pedococcus sp. 5OH_020 TaxID=2989814 RepID=UPI0022E9CAC8|nr:hypothetical protein [Pedococcus sp. 5OH_020]
MFARLLTAPLALGGTSIQMWLSLRQVAVNHREAIRRKGAEEDLVKELPLKMRRRARREFVRDREPELHRAIRQTWLHLWSWGLLLAAAASAVTNVLLGGITLK